jgi:hypothetical protein
MSLTLRVCSYHDWEHFSSIRNLRGPHSGLPNVSELSADSGACTGRLCLYPQIPSCSRLGAETAFPSAAEL